MSVTERVLHTGTSTRLALCCVALAASCSSTPDIAEPTLTTISESSAATDSTTDAEQQDDATSSPAPSAAASDTTTNPEPSNAPLSGELTATVVDTHPHDGDAFTQGLELLDGRFVEGTGLYGESDRRLVDIETGEPTLIVPIDANLFGEGVTVVSNEVLQLTWKAGVLIRSDAATLEEISRDTYDGEGWGLCFDGETLAMSNGSPTITFRDPQTFETTRTVDVTLDGTPVENLNELECVNGQVIANVWLTDLVVVIDPSSGQVVATLDAADLRPDTVPAGDSSFALNGIAHDPTTGRFYLTGKLWPVIYEVELS